MIRFFALLVIALALCACKKQEAPSPFVGLYANYKDCRARYADIDAKIDAAGVRDAIYYRVPGYPYLRTERTLASFRKEMSDEVLNGWIRHMRDYDQEAREFEYINLGLSKQEAAILRFDLVNCSRALTAVELDDPEALKRVVEAANPPDDYSDIARALHLYPLMVPLLHSEIAHRQDAVKAAFARPLDALKPRGTLALWKVKPTEDLSLVADGFGKAPADELGFPGLVDSAWRALAEVNAPQFLIDTLDERDQPAAPVLSANGPTVNVSQPTIYYRISFTRFGDRPLTQINYFIWFKGRDDAREGSVEQNLDGMIWRVTLDERARPMVYESLHASGRDHLWFATPAMKRRSDGDDYWQEPALFPQPQIPAGPLVLRLAAGTHALERILSADQVSAQQTQSFDIHAYEDLFTLPRPDGSSRSLFGPDGLVAGSRDSNGFLRHASGVKAPGEPRELGHQTATEIGRREFDDPFILESVFVPTPAEPPPG